MATTFLSVREQSSGYYDVLKLFRTEVPLATRSHHPAVKFETQGMLPQQIKEALPIFGSAQPTDYCAMNSGGRGILLSDGTTHLRFKGVDVDGSITQRVAASPKNAIADIRLSAQQLPRFDATPLSAGQTHHVPSYNGKPFSFLTRDATVREQRAADIVAHEFERKGWKAPYRFAALIEYPTILHHGETCTTAVFTLPSVESDLRFAELYRLAYIRLKHAAPDALKDISDTLGKFFHKLTMWHGFTAAILMSHDLAPTPASHQHQNYVLCHVNATEIGASRVDHTSTMADAAQAAAYGGHMKQEIAFFGTMHIDVLHAIKLADDGYKVDEDRYTGYYDRAVKWHEGFDLTTVPGALPYFKSLNRAFHKGCAQRDPEPINQKHLISLVQQLSAIPIDEERQQRVTRTMEQHLGLAVGSLPEQF